MLLMLPQHKHDMTPPPALSSKAFDAPSHPPPSTQGDSLEVDPEMLEQMEEEFDR
jgi:hypothetical protein